uniref:NADH-ubiquinone oxidoreductase chain 4 n=1 Tax=Testudotaenia sp. WL-2016 TaxID=1873314 RepID=A0A1B1XZ27_9CEST|nr:NADH dehydrogenase subunit 4 [Testudotaenia sp. WL-2016]
MFKFISCNVFLIFSFLLLCPLFYSVGLSLVSFHVNGSLFIFDSLSFYLILLVLFLGLYSIACCGLSFSGSTSFFLFASLVFSCLCFCVNHSIMFWFFYELAMLPLLYLIFYDSPYSERFIAGWYFAAYLLVTSLPLVLVLIYLSFVNGSFYFSNWSCGSVSSFAVLVILSFIFFTKVPLSPFHTWLPIVHAEATSIVSIFLSGYIMKLGLLGVFRCTPFIFSDSFFVYVFLCCVFSVFFLITSSKELDGKRWLAFLSLSHIVIPFLGLYVCSWEVVSLTFLFCFGHGLSAGLVFGMLWYFYDSTNTRNWLLLKSGVSGKVGMSIVIVGMLSLCSFPPTLQFFCEVSLLSMSSTSSMFLLFWSFYLFFGGLVPLVLCGHILIRSECFETSSFSVVNFAFYFFFLSIWCYLGIFSL